MRNAEEHYARAVEMLNLAAEDTPPEDERYLLAAANVHAILALACSTDERLGHRA